MVGVFANNRLIVAVKQMWVIAAVTNMSGLNWMTVFIKLYVLTSFFPVEVFILLIGKLGYDFNRFDHYFTKEDLVDVIIKHDDEADGLMFSTFPVSWLVPVVVEYVYADIISKGVVEINSKIGVS